MRGRAACSVRQKRGQRRAVAAPGRRAERVAEQVQRVLSALLVQRVSDPRLQGVVVTRVHLTPDLRMARIFVHSLMLEGSDSEAIRASLGAATPFFRRELAADLDLRFTPELRFFWDEPLDERRRIDLLLRGARASSPSSVASVEGGRGEEEGEAEDE